MAQLDSITATFKIVTPLFLGDVERQATRFSLASLKGAVRFWWRALAWPEIRASAADQAAALGALWHKERALFGAAGAAGREGSGQSRVIIRLSGAADLGTALKVDRELRDRGGKPVGPGARYLGYGLMGAFGARQGRLDRSCFDAGGQLTVQLHPRAGLDVGGWESVVRAVRLLGLLGGLGARSRRGWGSLALQAVSGDPSWRTPSDVPGYRAMLETTLPSITRDPELPPFTAFSAWTRIDVVHLGDDPIRVLDHVGQQMQRYRAWGFRGQVNGKPSERNFTRDHDWSKAPWTREFAGYVPQRASFGLPHTYGKGPGVTPAAEAAGDRRASPLLIHIHALDDGRYAAVLALLPARFVPGDEVSLTWPSQRQPARARMPEDWPAVLHGFLDGPPRARERNLTLYFPEKTPILRPTAGVRG